MRRFLIAVFPLLLLGAPSVGLAASLSVSPGDGTLSIGDRITVSILVSSDVSVNAISGMLTFPNSAFAVDSVSKNSSIIDFWPVEPTYSNGEGAIHFEGVALAGFEGNGGRVLSVTLRALSKGPATLAFQNAQVLANDGHGTDVTNGLAGATFIIVPASPPAAKPAAALAKTAGAPVSSPEGSSTFPVVCIWIFSGMGAIIILLSIIAAVLLRREFRH